MSFSLKCPTCKKVIQWDASPSRPFCSERCRLVDLGAWADGSYSIPCSENQAEKDHE